MAAINLAADCTYTVFPGPNANYPDTGGVELTDELIPSINNYKDNRWVGWQNTDATIVIDLGSSKSFNYVNVYQLSNTLYGIYAPSLIEVLGSNDNNGFISLATASVPLTSAWFTIQITTSTKYRYVKVICTRTPSKEWLFIGEIQVTAVGDVDDDYTTALLHFDGMDTGIIFDDEVNTMVTVFGNSQTKTTIKKLGTASGYFDGSGDYLTISNATNFNFGSGDFTVDWWEYRVSKENGKTTIARRNDTAPYLFGYTDGGSNVLCYMSSNRVSWDIANAKIFGEVNLNAWHHFAVCRSGDTFYLFMDGVAGDSWMSSGALYDETCPLQIGCYNVNYFTGYIDELRVSKGIARWTADFTPPTKPYGASSPSNNGIFFATFI